MPLNILLTPDPIWDQKWNYIDTASTYRRTSHHTHTKTWLNYCLNKDNIKCYEYLVLFCFDIVMNFWFCFVLLLLWISGLFCFVIVMNIWFCFVLLLLWKSGFVLFIYCYEYLVLFCLDIVMNIWICFVLLLLRISGSVLFIYCYEYLVLFSSDIVMNIWFSFV